MVDADKTPRPQVDHQLPTRFSEEAGVQKAIHESPRMTAQRRKISGFLGKGVVQGMFYEHVKDGAPIFHWGPVIDYLWAPKLDGDGQQEMEGGYGVWVRKGSVQYITQIVEQDERIQDLTNNVHDALQSINVNLDNKEQVISALKATHDVALDYLNQLKETLSRYAIPSMLGLAATVGATVLAQHFLSLPAVPWSVKMCIDLAGVLYGAYISVRWLQSTVLPKLGSLVMAAANTAMWSIALYPMFTEIVEGRAFSSVHIAALPLAITLEILMRRIDAKIRDAGKKPTENQALLEEGQQGNYASLI